MRFWGKKEIRLSRGSEILDFGVFWGSKMVKKGSFLVKKGSKSMIFGVFWEKMTVFWVFGEMCRPGLLIFPNVRVLRGVYVRFWGKKEIRLSRGRKSRILGYFGGQKMVKKGSFLVKKGSKKRLGTSVPF